jgi:hypothetical protein
MTQAANGSTPQIAAHQACDGDTLHRLKALSALISFLTHGCLDLGGPELQDAMGFVYEEFADCVEQIEERTKRSR